MFNVGGPEFLVILLVALIVLGPSRLPDAARQVGKFMGEMKRMSSGFQQEFKNAIDDGSGKSARTKGASLAAKRAKERSAKAAGASAGAALASQTGVVGALEAAEEAGPAPDGDAARSEATATGSTSVAATPTAATKAAARRKAAATKKAAAGKKPATTKAAAARKATPAKKPTPAKKATPARKASAKATTKAATATRVTAPTATRRKPLEAAPAKRPVGPARAGNTDGGAARGTHSTTNGRDAPANGAAAAPAAADENAS